VILQLVADGLTTGAILGLGALGLTLSMRILRFANFSHAELLTWGAYLALGVVAFGAAGPPLGPLSFGWPLLAAAALAAVATGGLALLVDRLLFRPLRARGAVAVTLIFASFGASLVLRNVLLLLWGPHAHYYGRELAMAVEVLPGVRVVPDQVFVLALALALVLAVHAFLARTRLGLAMRATAESPTLARVSGIEVEAVVRWTWILSGALAAAGGVFFGLTVQIRPEMGFSLLLPIFAAVVLGGLDSLAGAVVGGLAVGLAESLSLLVVPPGYKPAVPFLVLILVLYFKPTGLFGSAAAR
jgi:branched-chain amino acid transport system permease protein